MDKLLEGLQRSLEAHDMFVVNRVLVLWRFLLVGTKATRMFWRYTAFGTVLYEKSVTLLAELEAGLERGKEDCGSGLRLIEELIQDELIW